ncbi:MAG: 3-hydroxybutyryl-CoA dehydrogenase [Betaproteobacteria bacterium]|nr:3-hydroxybutyryl-CoA dehydrogenase [Betaproteobacteria bacterium]
MDIRTIGVVGAGTMGNGIAQVCAMAGYPVVITDIAQAALDRAMKTVDGSLERMVNKQKLTAADKTATLARLALATDMKALADCDLVIEAATENIDLKLKIFASIDATVKPGAIIASNTSSISITKLAAATRRPAQFIGMHFFNPVPVMVLVELIRGMQTGEDTLAAARAVVLKIGKAPIVVRNSPGFAVNRILVPMLNEACFALGEGVATPEDIDEGMKLGCNHPIGPLALCDMIGLDVMLDVMNVFYSSFNDPKYRPAPLLVEMVEAGYLGRKSGRGFYSYDKK